MPWDLDSSYLKAWEGAAERSRNVGLEDQPCQAGDGRPAELDILKPWFPISNALGAPLPDVIQNPAASASLLPRVDRSTIARCCLLG